MKRKFFHRLTLAAIFKNPDKLRTYYDILDINQNANQIEIKRAYKVMALKFHPDRNKEKNAHEKFIEINQAYEILKDETLRNKYDSEIFEQSNLKKQEQNESEFVNSNFEDFDLRSKNEEIRRKAEDYARMSFNEFFSSVESIIESGRVVKRKVKSGLELGCGYICLILAVLGFIKLILGILGLDSVFSYPIQIILILVFGFLGWAATLKK